MESKNLSDQKEYDNNENKNYPSSKNSLYKSDLDSHQISKPCEYYPIESDKSKNGGHTIYLVTKAEENFNDDNGDEINEPKNYNGANINESNNDINDNNSKVDDPLVSQRSIELQINKGKFIYFLNGSQTFKQNNNNNHEERFNIDFNDVKVKNLKNNFSNKDLNKDMNNIKSVSNNFKSLNMRQITDENIMKKLKYKKVNDNDNYNNNNNNNNNSNLNKTTAYIRKININKKSYKENGILNENSNSKKLNQSTVLKNIRNQKFDITKTIPESKFKKLDDISKHSLIKNNSLFDLFPKNKYISETNRSYNKKDNISSFYNSLEYFKNNINENLDNSKIMEKSFLSGMKNEDRKKSLKNAITIYNRFKSFGKFKKMNLYCTPLSPLAKKIKYDINKDKKNDDSKNNINNNEKDINDNNKNIDNNKVIDDVDNDNIGKNNENNNNEINYESSIINFNESINIKEEKENESFAGENNDHEFSFTSELKKYDETKDNINIEENTSKNIILKDNELIDVLNTEIIEESNQEKEKEIEKQKKEDDKEEIEKNENNFHKKLNKSVDIKSNKNQTRNNDFKLDELNDINKTINEGNIDTKKNKPSYFVRKVIREEHYYIDENGKEKLLEVKQRLINDEINLKKFKKTPYVKKNLSLKGIDSKNKRNDGKNRNSYFITNRQNKNDLNMDENSKNEISKNCNKLIKSNKKINLSYIENEIKDKIPERATSKELKLDELNITEIMPDPTSSKQNDIFKEFNKLFFKNKPTTNDINNKKTTDYYQIKTQERKTYKKNFNEPASAKQRNILSLNKKVIDKKDIFNIKKENPIVIKSVNCYDNSSKITRSKPFLNIKDNSNEKLKFNDYSRRSNNNMKESPFKEEKEKGDENELKEIDSYIKVNKMEKYKKINTEKILEINNRIKNSYPKRDFNKNHVFHEIKAGKNSQKKLSSNSQSIYFTHNISNDDLNSSNRNHEYSVKTLNTERRTNLMINIHNSNVQNSIDLNKILAKQQNFGNKSNSESYFILNTRTSNRNNKEKNHHRYYESRSTKNKLKESDNESDANSKRYTINYSKALDKNNYKKLYKNEPKDRYFYQNWGNNSPTSVQYNNEKNYI